MPELIFLIHKSKEDIKLGLEKSDFINIESKIVESGTYDALLFITKYIKFYTNNKELDAPEYPLEEHINAIFKQEEDIMLPLLELENETKESILKKLVFAKDIAHIAEELNMSILFKKMAAIISHYIQHDNLK